MRDRDRDQVARALPAYDVGDRIGQGTWGTIWRARHRALDRDVAVRQLPAIHAPDETLHDRFVAAARALAALRHLHVAPVYDFAAHDGFYLLVTEHLAQGWLLERADDGRLDMQTSCAAVLAACSGLHHAHQHAVLHRAITPRSLMFSEDGYLRVEGFGLAGIAAGPTGLPRGADGELLGHPAYMAPELASQSRLGPATDVYSAALVLYEFLARRLPYAVDRDPVSALYRHANESPWPLPALAPWVPASIAQVVMTGLSPQPEDRQESAEEFGTALAEGAGRAWGPDWLSVSSVAVCRGPIAAAARVPVAGATVPEPEPEPEPVVLTAPSKRSGRLISSAAVAIVVLLGLALAALPSRPAPQPLADPPAPASAPPGPVDQTVASLIEAEPVPTDPVAIAVAISQRTYGEGETTPGVVLAGTPSFAAALASGGLQGLAGAPLLLTDPAQLSPQTLAEIRRLNADTVHLLGGVADISDTVEQQLHDAGAVTYRHEGENYLAAAISIARQHFAGADTAILAASGSVPGELSPDRGAISAGILAAQRQVPVLLTRPDVLSEQTAGYLRRSAITKVVIVGDEQVVGPRVEAALRLLGVETSRVKGSDAAEIAVAVAGELGFGLSSDVRSVLLVEGNGPTVWPGTFAVPLQAARIPAPVVLANGAELPGPTSAFLCLIGHRAAVVCAPGVDPEACARARALAAAGLPGGSP